MVRLASRLVCVTITALGSTVVPDENCRNAGCSGSTSTGCQRPPPVCKSLASRTSRRDSTPTTPGPSSLRMRPSVIRYFAPILANIFRKRAKYSSSFPQPERRIERGWNAAGKLHAQQRIEKLDRGGKDQGHAVAALESARLQCRGGLLRAAQHVLVRIKRGLLGLGATKRAPQRVHVSRFNRISGSVAPLSVRALMPAAPARKPGRRSSSPDPARFPVAATVPARKAQPKSCSMVVTSTTCASESSCRASISETLGPIASICSGVRLSCSRAIFFRCSRIVSSFHLTSVGSGMQASFHYVL
jgi:hypothetical protein